jgi:hypothetical protein
MNIFVLDQNPKTAAQMLCDCHVRKMCVETAQILSGVMLRRNLPLLDGMPKPQNINHPVIVAAEESVLGTNWLLLYALNLDHEFYYRFGKLHKYSDIFDQYVRILEVPSIGHLPYNLAKCCGNLDVSGLGIVSAYRKYYTEVKKPALQSKGLWNFTNRKDWTE